MVYRAYVFTGYNTTILMFLGTCYLTLVGIELWAFLTPPVAVQDAVFALFGKFGCFADFSHPLMQLRIAVRFVPAVLKTKLT